MAGVLTLTGSPASFTEPLTAAEVKEWLKISDPSPAIRLSTMRLTC